MPGLAALRGINAARASIQASTHGINPIAYAQNVLRVSLTDDQKTILESVQNHRRTLVKASHSVGKTHVASVAANWWFDRADKAIVYVTAPNWKQALGLTFKEVKQYRLNLKLPGDILDSGLVRDTRREYQYAHYIRALNAESGEGFQGEHSAPILIILEEGVGVPNYIWQAMEGLMTNPECRLLVIGNPTDESTDFGNAAASSRYNVLSISGLDHPNIEAELNCQPRVIPNAISLQWLYEMMQNEVERVDSLTEDAFEWWDMSVLRDALSGIPFKGTSPKCYYQPTGYFQGRVLGEFPTQADQNVIPRGWLKSLVVQEIDDSEPEIGCDVARFGDDRTTIFIRIGACLVWAKEIRKMDTVEIAAALIQAATLAVTMAKNKIEPKRVKIKIDVTGGLGAGPYDNLKHAGYRVVAVNSSESAKDKEQFKNVRSELWFEMRERAKDKRLDVSRLPKEIREKLIREWSSPKYLVRSQKIVEDKAETKKRLGVSPDLADGANLAYYNAVEQTYRYSSY